MNADPVQLEKAIRIVLDQVQATTPAAAAVLRAALEGRRFNEKFVEDRCRRCQKVATLPLYNLANGPGACDDCAAVPPPKRWQR